MAYLFCANDTASSKKQYEQGVAPGELVRVTEGALLENYVCDRCGKHMSSGEHAGVVEFVPKGREPGYPYQEYFSKFESFDYRGN